MYERKEPHGAPSKSADEDKAGFHFVAVYSSIASLIWYVYSFRMAAKVGWQQSMMDVVHEIGSDTANLNLYNVGVADAKQTCAHSAMAVHSSRKGHVFEATSACLHAAAEFVWEHLHLINEVCRHYKFSLEDYFMLNDSFYPSGAPTTSNSEDGVVHVGIEPNDSLTRDVVDGLDRKFLQPVKGRTVTLRMAFPLRLPGSSSYFPSVTPDASYYGAVTDGDHTMWKRHILHVPCRHYEMLQKDPKDGAMGLRYCDRHKGELMRKSGNLHYSEQLALRKKNTAAYDRRHPLGKLMEKSWSQNFEHLLEVIRAHPHPGVSALFLAVKAHKAVGMGLKTMQDADVKNHDPNNVITGVFGQSAYTLKRTSGANSSDRKSGMSFTANCLEAGPNKAAKKALGMQSSLAVILAVLQAACRKNTRDHMNICFSVRQDFAGQNPRNNNAKNKQCGEEITGDFFREIWKTGLAKATSSEWVKANIFPASGSKSITTNWAGVSVFLPTVYGVDMALNMSTYSEYAMTANGKHLKEPRESINVAHYKGGFQKNLQSNLTQWKKFDASPESFCPFDFYNGLQVVDARRDLADPNFLKKQHQTKIMNDVEAYLAYEKYMLFWQHAYVHVTANPNVLTGDEALQFLSESWRFKRLNHGAADKFAPVDFGAYRCTCRQFAKYAFCEHCVIVGTLQRLGPTCSAPAFA